MQLTIYIPKDLKKYLPEMIAEAKKDNEKDGLGKYLVNLHRVETDSKILKALLSDLAEAADSMLTLLVDNKPIDGLWSTDIDNWDQLIKEGKK